MIGTSLRVRVAERVRIIIAGTGMTGTGGEADLRIGTEREVDLRIGVGMTRTKGLALLKSCLSTALIGRVVSYVQASTTAGALLDPSAIAPI